ncbi:MAG: DUF2179 domain-containing protein, partial [Firmicutes bacterium]|nr:DUF2179 domain-containing protein [Bacillota bacterium]
SRPGCGGGSPPPAWAGCPCQTSSGHGSTMYSAIGGHEKNPTYIIQTVLDKKDLFRVKEQILKNDPTAFITVTNVSEVNGRGFTIDVDGK